ncbi:MAG: amidohydrolase family protein [Candidatus Thermoplasmatota archaeon]
MERKITLPLLHDHHNHPSQYGAFFDSADISGIKDKEKAVSIIKNNTVEGKPNVVLGWNNSYFTFSEEDLQELPPVIICNLSFHGFLSNDKAEKLIEKNHGNTKILENMKDPDWMEANLPKIMKFLIKIEGLDVDKLRAFYDFLLEKGVWRTEEMLLPSEEAFQAFKKLDLTDRTEFWTDLPTYQNLSTEVQKEIKGIKIFTDGALGPKTAAIKESYPEGDDGVLLHDEDSLKRLIEDIETKMVSIHAIGNRATEKVVESLETVSSLPDIRIEHAQFIDKDTAEKAKSLDVTLSMQPNFSLDSVHYRDRLSKKYLKRNNPFRMLIDEVGFVPGDDLIFGSDGMPHGVKEALSSSLFPPYLGQELTIEEFIDGYCTDEDVGEIEISIDEKEEVVSIKDIRA